MIMFFFSFLAWKEKGNEFRVLQFIFRKAEDIDSIEAAATPVQAREGNNGDTKFDILLRHPLT